MISRKLPFLFLFSVPFVAIGGCGKAPDYSPQGATVAIGEGTAGITVSYDLTAVNGAAVPATVYHGESKIRVHSGVLEIRTDGTCSSETVFGPPSGGKVTRVAHAACTRKDSGLLMHWRGAGTTTGAFAGETFSMDNHGMILSYTRSARTGDWVIYSGVGECGSGSVVAEAKKARVGVFEDFDSGLRTGRDGAGHPIGFFTFRDSDNSTVATFTTSTHPRRPGAGDDNAVLQLDLDVEAWAGVAHNFENESVDTWLPRDWRGFNQFSFWLYGNNRGISLYVEILDNRKSCPESGGAELYSHVFTDNFSGWRLVTVPFAKLVRKEIGNDAPNDGLGLSEVHGWAFGALNTAGPVTYYLDDFELR